MHNTFLNDRKLYESLSVFRRFPKSKIILSLLGLFAFFETQSIFYNMTKIIFEFR